MRKTRTTSNHRGLLTAIRSNHRKHRLDLTEYELHVATRLAQQGKASVDNIRFIPSREEYPFRATVQAFD